MRASANLDADVWAAVVLLRKELGLGIGEAINWLARHGIEPAKEATKPDPRTLKFPY